MFLFFYILLMFASLFDFFQGLAFNDYVEIFGTLIGLVYLYLQYVNDPRFWPTAIVNALPFVYLFLLKGNYASAILFTYYLVMGVQMTFFAPRHSSSSSSSTHDRPITSVPLRLYPWLALLVMALTSILYGFLLNIESWVNRINTATGWHLPIESPHVPLADAFVTALSFVGMWLLAQKYIQHWFVWVVVNGVFVYIQIISGLYQWGALFTVYGIVAVLGYFNWRRLQSRATSPR